ncbi:MAG TPA: cytochrome c oxidase assembly protein [Acidimicrobiales bacterium]|nr:cytochrome c oxidase assembly protein [Acidimicrobiales bacterium]
MGPLLLADDDMPPVLNWHHFGAFQIDFASVLIVGAAVLYAAGVWRVNRAQPDRKWSGKRCLAFAGGLVVTFLAVEGFVGVYDDVLFYDHMVQHLMLIMVAAPLFAMGAPVELLQRACTGTGRVGDLVDRSLGSRLADLVAHPVVDFLLYAVLIPVCHLTSFYNFTLTHEQAHDSEHLLFLVIGYLFWRHVVAVEPSRHPLHPAVRLLYLALAVPVDTFTGLALASSSHELFPAYDALRRPWGPTRLADLHIGGVIMWVCGDSLMLLAMVPVALQWMRQDERDASDHDRQLTADSG